MNKTLKFEVYIERDREGNYIYLVAELSGCHTKARSIEAVMAKIVDAVDVYLDAENHETDSLYELVAIKVIDVPKREMDLAASDSFVSFFLFLLAAPAQGG